VLNIEVPLLLEFLRGERVRCRMLDLGVEPRLDLQKRFCQRNNVICATLAALH
jgi:hypothetical protein